MKRGSRNSPRNVQDAIRALGRAAEQQAFPWGVNNVQKTNALWLANKGEILNLPAQEQASMMQAFVSLGTNIVCAKSRGEGRDGQASGACRRQTAEVTSSSNGLSSGAENPPIGPAHDSCRVVIRDARFVDLILAIFTCNSGRRRNGFGEPRDR
jgi:hypothetical protein